MADRSCPNNRTVPAVGITNPTQVFKTVDLPDPEQPKNATESRASMVNVASCTTG